MVYLSRQVLSEGNEFEEIYDTPKPVSEMEDEEIREFLGKFGMRGNIIIICYSH